jgi:hypothetical protein
MTTTIHETRCDQRHRDAFCIINGRIGRLGYSVSVKIRTIRHNVEYLLEELAR